MADPVPIEHAIKESRERLGAIRKSRRLAPQRQDFEREFPGKVDVVAGRGGKREWRLRVRTHDRNGQRTAEGKRLQGMMMPYVRSEAARARMLAGRQGGTVPMRDQNGSVHHVPAHLEGHTAGRGFHSASRPGGNRVERGAEGMLWRLSHGEWRPMGRWCTGTPSARPARVFVGARRDGSVRCIGLQHDPDGAPWRALDGRWVPL